MQTRMGELFDDRSFYVAFEQVAPEVFHNQLIKMIGSPFLDQVRDYTLGDAVVAMPNIFRIDESTAREISERILELK